MTPESGPAARSVAAADAEAARRLLSRVRRELSGARPDDAAEPDDAPLRAIPFPELPLPFGSVLPVRALALGSVAAIALAAVDRAADRAEGADAAGDPGADGTADAGSDRRPASTPAAPRGAETELLDPDRRGPRRPARPGRGAASIRLDPLRIAAAYASERVFRWNGEPMDPWAPLSGFHPTGDGWLRTHANYPHHAAALRAAIGLPADADRGALRAALAGWTSAGAASAIRAAGGIAAEVAAERPELDTAMARGPLLAVRRLGDAPASPRPPRVQDAGAAAAAASGASGRGTTGPAAVTAPLAGIRVLDLTRVIAGPVAGRTLALLGAEVLRIDPPHPAELPWQHLDTGHGKRSAVLDARTPDGRSRLEGLLAGADVVLLGYRPAALAALGLDPDSLAARHPGLVVGRLSAWGADAAHAGGRGFDSIVQAASGIAWIESPDGATPGALPAQALDHSTGYLLAAGIVTLLGRREREGGSWLVETSLRRVAAELLTMPRGAFGRAAVPGELETSTGGYDSDAGELRTALPAVAFDGGPADFPAPPRPWGADAPDWDAPPERSVRG